MKKHRETKYCVYAKGVMVPLYSSTSKVKADRKAAELRTRPKRPLDVEVRKETYVYETGNLKLPGKF